MDTPRPIGFWLKLVDRLIDEQFASTLEEHGVTRRQWQLLNVLSRESSTAAQLDAAVAPFLNLTPPEPGEPEASVEHLTELIDSGWVDATPSGYELTERGRNAFDRLADVVAVSRARMTEGLTAEQYDETLAVLERMARNLGFEG
ncbi:MAG: MarR family winged helix-turn-helix transcriptional regulator [Rhodoglobus sp.]